MSVFQAFVLGLVQGFSEFLPISSSGHLLLTRWVFGWDELDESIAKSFDVALHLGTLVAVVSYFRSDVGRYIGAGVRSLRVRRLDADGRIAWLLLAATVPAALTGALLEDWIDGSLGTPVVIACSLIGFGLLLGWADRCPGDREIDDLEFKDAAIIGTAQIFALNPGTSRSGITMTAARADRFTRDAAARISFLLSIPVIAGAVVLKFGGLLADWPEGLLAPMLVGVATSAVSGWVAVWGTIKLLRTHSFMPFMVYRVVVGVAILVVVAAGWR